MSGQLDIATANVCAIRRRSDGYWWGCNLEHGAGWTKRIRQAWTPREAQLEVLSLFERGFEPAGSADVVELAPREPVQP